MIVDLPEHLVISVISEWMVCQEVVALDSAWSICRERKHWLHMLARTSSHLWPTDIKWTNKGAICCYLNWIADRKVVTKGINLTLDLPLENLLVKYAKTDDNQVSFPQVKSITLDASLFDLGLPSVPITSLFPLMEEIELCHLSSDILWQLRQSLLSHPTLTRVKFTQRTSFFEELLQTMVTEVGDKLQRLSLLACLSTPLLQCVADHAPNIQEVCCASDVHIPDMVTSLGRFRQLKTLRIRLGRHAQGVQELSKVFDYDSIRCHIQSVYIGSDHLHIHILPILTKALLSCKHLQEVEMCGLYAKIDKSAGEVTLKLSGPFEVTDACAEDMVAFLSTLTNVKLPIKLIAHGSLFYTEHLCRVLEKANVCMHVDSLTLSLRDVDKPYTSALVKLCTGITSLHLMHHSNRDRSATLALLGCIVRNCKHIHTLSLHHLYNGQHAHVTNDQDVNYFLQHLSRLHTLDLTHFTTSQAVLQYLSESKKVMHKVCLSGLGITTRELYRAYGQHRPAIKLFHYQATSFHKLRVVGYGKMPIRVEHLGQLFAVDK
ncbi:hypothetical protein EON65_18035 [archaeon]|nr:MAG: hypothetical protein EON65_18035 [archaeon]